MSTVTTARRASDKTAKAGTIAGATAFLAGGVGTILAAIGDFGSSSSALAAARRNHVDSLLAAAGLAALGLALGGLYPFLRHWRRRAHPIEPARVLLAVGVVSVAAGVAVGSFATIARRPGRPTIVLQRFDRSSVRIEVTADGLASSDWYEAIVTQYTPDERGGETATTLAAARFSPGQNGKLDWKERIAYPSSSPADARLLVRVAKDRLVRETDCNTDQDVTCLSVRVPVTSVR